MCLLVSSVSCFLCQDHGLSYELNSGLKSRFCSRTNKIDFAGGYVDLFTLASEHFFFLKSPFPTLTELLSTFLYMISI